MTAAESLNALGKLQSFLELFARAKVVLQDAARAEQEDAQAKERLAKALNEAQQAESVATAAKETAAQAIAKRDQIIADNERSTSEAVALAAQLVTSAKEEAKKIFDSGVREQALAKENVASLNALVDSLNEKIGLQKAELAGLQANILSLRKEARERFA
jgi:hypothetical protein